MSDTLTVADDLVSVWCSDLPFGRQKRLREAIAKALDRAPRKGVAAREEREMAETRAELIQDVSEAIWDAMDAETNHEDWARAAVDKVLLPRLTILNADIGALNACIAHLENDAKQFHSPSPSPNAVEELARRLERQAREHSEHTHKHAFGGWKPLPPEWFVEWKGAALLRKLADENEQLKTEKAELLETWQPPATLAVKDASIQMLQDQIRKQQERIEELEETRSVMVERVSSLRSQLFAAQERAGILRAALEVSHDDSA